MVEGGCCALASWAGNIDINMTLVRRARDKKGILSVGYLGGEEVGWK